jgi:hypothetical protein
MKYLLILFYVDFSGSGLHHQMISAQVLQKLPDGVLVSQTIGKQCLELQVLIM